MKQGFMLIELIIASLIASMVAAVLLAALAQGNRFMTIVDNLVDTSVRVGVASHQLEKDLMGAFIPQQAKQPLDTPATQALGASGGDASAAQGNKDKQPEKKGAENTPQKKEAKVIDKIFYSTNKNGQFDTLTFITNNPLIVYVGKDVGTVKPKAVRVQYALKPEADKKNSYALFRQESNELDLENYKNVTAYELIGGIKSCNMTFTARIEKKQEQAKASAEKTPEKPKIEYEYKTQHEWVSEQKKESDKKEKEEFPRIPYSVEIKMILWDRQDKREKEFTFICQIPTDFSESKEQESEQRQQPAKEEKSAQDKGKEQQSGQQNGKATIEVIALNDLEKLISQLGNITKSLTRM